MCGINGYQGSFNRELIVQMNKVISHRGPDYQDFEVNKYTGLGHVRLSIIDISSASNQPMTSRCGRYILVFNGEIYNYKEIKIELISNNIHFRSEGDSEVLLELWALEGVSCLNKLDGIFSFAIYDKENDSIFVVRDNFGIKPLYYSEIAEGVIFSSEIKAILQCDLVSREIDYSSVASCLTFLWQAGVDTILKEVKKLDSGSYLYIKNNKIDSIVKYYQPPAYCGNLEYEDSLHKLREEMKKSVESQLVADVEIGAFLSGGLDSSLICSIAKQNDVNFRRVYTIDINVDGNQKEGLIDDLPYAKKVACLLNLELNIIKADPDFFKLLSDCIYHLDEPQGDPAAINTYIICQEAKQSGVKVLLSGTGGDDLFTGYRRHYAISINNWFKYFPVSIKGKLAYFAKYIPQKNPFLRRVTKVLNSLRFSGNLKLASYFFWLDEDEVIELFSEKTQKENNINKPSQKLVSFLKAGSKEENDVEKILRLEKEFFLRDHNLNYTDKMSMAHGVEVRVPFVTKRMMEIAAQIPTNFKQNGKEGKWILKKAAEQWLPKHVIFRKKTGFGVPLRGWIHGPLKPLIGKLLSKESIERRGIFDGQTVLTMIKDDFEGKRDCAYTIYALLALEIWFRQFIDYKVPRKLTYTELLES